MKPPTGTLCIAGSIRSGSITRPLSARTALATNAAESLFSRLRGAEIGHYHHLSGAYLDRYARETAFREDHRRTANGEQFGTVVGLVAKNGPSVDFCGYWQRARAA